MASQDGRELFKKLVKSADFVIESFPPGFMAGLGLDYPALSEINPKVIMTSITPFGQTGPYQDYKSSELGLMALGVFMFGTGDRDRPPVKPNYPLAGITSGISGACATIIAHHHCRKTGRGQHIDVSAQAGPVWFTGNVGPWWQVAGQEMHRAGPYNVRRPDFRVRFYWPCRDGYVAFQLYGGVTGKRNNRAMATWMTEAGMGDEYFNRVDWEHLDILELPEAELRRLEEPIGPFFLSKTRQELVTEATRRGILLGYFDRLEDIYQNPQLASGFWKDVAHAELGRSLPYPGLFVRSSLVECGIRQRAPLIGEHNDAVYAELGIAKEQLLSLNQAGVI